MRNTLLYFIILLSVPLMFLNWGAGIVGAGWLFFSFGNWKTPLYAFGVSLIAPFVLSFPLMISIIFAVPGAFLFKKGFFGKILSFPFLILSGLITWIIMAAWGILVFGYSVDISGSSSPDLIPHLLIAYTVSTSPWIYLTSKEFPNPSVLPSSSVLMPCFATQLGAAATVYNIGIAKADSITVLATYLGIMIIGYFLGVLSGTVSIKPKENA